MSSNRHPRWTGTLKTVVAGISLALASVSASAQAETYTVISTTDDGAACCTEVACPAPATLRQAICAANLGAGADTIEFNISGTGPFSIEPLNALPAITEAVTIDGFSQPGATSGEVADIQIILDGSTAAGTGLSLEASSATVNGLWIRDFQDGVSVGGDGADLFRNRVTNNAEAGVAVTGVQVEISECLFGDNDGLAIDLYDDGVTGNSGSGGGDCGYSGTTSNNGIDFPVITGFDQDGSNNLIVVGTACAGAEVQVYRAVAGAGDGTEPTYGEGVEWLGATTADGGGDFSLTTATSAASIVGQLATALAIDGDGNTSEFAANVEVAVCGDGSVDGAEDCDAGTANGDTDCGCQLDCTWGAAESSCADDGNECTDDECDGGGSCIHPDLDPGSPCGDQGVDCRYNDYCDGAGGCLDQGVWSLDTPCGDPSNSQCTLADTCDDAGNCLANHRDPGYPCGDQGVPCHFADGCDGNGLCQDAGFVPQGTDCGDPTDDECTDPDTCDDAGSCLPNHAAFEAPCGDQGHPCRNDDYCSGTGVCVDAGIFEVGTACGSAASTECTAPDSCDALGDCAPNHTAAGTSCGDDDDSVCDRADTCDGAGSCDDNIARDGRICADNGSICDGDDVCDSGVCVNTGPPCDAATQTCVEATAQCVPKCGDGFYEPAALEDCDDGNREAGDGCADDCTVETGWRCSGSEGRTSVCEHVCGDGQLIEDLEECDDNNGDNGDGCSSLCEVERGWACLTEDDDPSECSVVCGDGLVVGDEQCDDANEREGDGCFDCLVEEDWVCDDSEPSLCGPEADCGDGVVGFGEDCDDGNLDDDDGCSSRCDVEPSWICDDSEPSLCVFDSDEDGVGDPDDNCPLVSNPEQGDADDDGRGDACDPDTDEDGVDDDSDNCPQVANPDQADLDGDALGDACDPDRDGDGLDNDDEMDVGTDPDDADSDDDGLDDGDEVGRGTNPLTADSDGGGQNDGDEVAAGNNPLDPSDDEVEEEDGCGCLQGPVTGGSVAWWALAALGCGVWLRRRRRGCRSGASG